MTLTDAILKRIKEIAKQHGLSPGKWAMKAGVLPNTFYAILDGRSRYPKIPTIKLLCEAVGMTLAEFFDVDYIENAVTDD